MGENDKAQDDTIAKIGKTLLPFWKSSNSWVKVVGLIPAVVLLGLWWKPWKEEKPTSEQKIIVPGNNNSINQAGHDVVNTTNGSVTQSIGPGNSGQVALLNQSPGASVNFGPRPWHITAEQKAKFVELLKDTPKGPVRVSICSNGGEESEKMANEITDALNAAGYSIGNIHPRGLYMRPPNGLVLLVLDPEHPPIFYKPISNALKEIGFNVHNGQSISIFVRTTNELGILIGTRPE